MKYCTIEISDQVGLVVLHQTSVQLVQGSNPALTKILLNIVFLNFFKKQSVSQTNHNLY